MSSLRRTLDGDVRIHHLTPDQRLIDPSLLAGHGRRYLIQSRGCPVGVAVTERPEVCEVIVTLLSELTAASVRSCCARSGRPSCCFEIAPAS